MGTYLRTKKGRNVKAHKQGGGWTGYEYERAAPGAMNSWNMDKGTKDKLANQRIKLAKAAGECKGQGKKFRTCVSRKLRGIAE